MNGFIVMQGETYKEEKKLGILWSPQKDKSGAVPPSYKRMQQIKKGDRIFHYVRGAIAAISVAKENCREDSDMKGADLPQHATRKGYAVKTDYYELETALYINEHIEQLASYLPVKYSAFQADGSGNPGYLYPCNEELMIKLLEIIVLQNVHPAAEEQLELAIEVIRRTEHNPLINLIAETELAARLKMQQGKEQHRHNMLPLWEGRCALCGTGLNVLLNASSSKPWKDSTDQERINPFNGVLLCRNHDAMYQHGLIAFDGKGRVHISKQISEEDYDVNGLASLNKISVKKENLPFFRWHKKHLFSAGQVDTLHGHDKI